MGVITSQQCFSEDWQRTNPDYAVYLPSRAPYHPEAADHTMVDYTPGGDLLAIWTSAFEFRGVDQSIAFSRSTDGGVSWSPRGIVSGPGPREGQKSQWHHRRDAGGSDRTGVAGIGPTSRRRRGGAGWYEAPRRQGGPRRTPLGAPGRPHPRCRRLRRGRRTTRPSRQSPGCADRSS